MRKRPTNFNTELARKQWDYAAEAFAELQASGNDYYRTGFFGPAQIDLCGDVSGLAVLDIGCGAGYFSRELSKTRKTALEIAEYFDRGPIEFEWKRPQQKYGWISTCVHAPLSDWIKWTTAAGFMITQIEEPMPTMEAVSRWPELEDARMVPYFIIFDLTK